MPDPTFAIETCELTTVYPGSQQPALREVCLTIRSGERVALVGANGAGKTTLLRVLAGLHRPYQGNAYLKGKEAAPGRSEVAYLPQQAGVQWAFPITAERFVLTGRLIHRSWPRRLRLEDRERARTVLYRLGLRTQADRPIGELSGGQQQRLLLARALCQDAKILLLDEPLNAIDAETRATLDTILDELREEGTTALIATHDVGRQESQFDQAVYLHNGERVEAPPGTPDLPDALQGHRHQHPHAV